ncbi:hypothetical protein V6N13_008785 [Hibiscus sabdariffa]
MASGSFLKHLNELDFTDEEQSMIFTPSIQWESTTEEADLFIIKKVISFETIDDLVVVRAFQVDDDNIAHQTEDSLGAMIGKVTKTDTHRIDLNIVDYLFSI